MTTAKSGSELVRMAYARGYRVDAEGRLWSYTGRQMHPGADRRGYPRFTYAGPRNNGKRLLRTVDVHRLAAFQKYGEDALRGGIHVRHLDENPGNFRLDNIAIGTPHENSMDRPPEKRRAHAMKAVAAIRGLTDPQVEEIRRLHSAGTPQKLLCEMFGQWPSTISQIVNGKLYRTTLDGEEPAP